MKTLLLMRHAKSGGQDSSLPDHERPLSKRGWIAAPHMARRLAHEGPVPDQVLCSSAVRARQSWEAMSGCFDEPVATITTDRLYLAPPDEILAVVATADPATETLLVVGHNPGMAVLVGNLTGQFSHFPTAAIALLKLAITEWPEALSLTAGRLADFWFPKDFGQ